MTVILAFGFQQILIGASLSSGETLVCAITLIAAAVICYALGNGEGYGDGWDDAVELHLGKSDDPVPYVIANETEEMADPTGGGTFPQFLASLSKDQKDKMSAFDEFGDSKQGVRSRK